IFVRQTKLRTWIGNRKAPRSSERMGRSSCMIGRLSPCKIAPLVIDENHSSTLSSAGNRPQILAQFGSTGRDAGVPAMGGARVSRGRERIDRPIHAPHLRQIMSASFLLAGFGLSG